MIGDWSGLRLHDTPRDLCLAPLTPRHAGLLLDLRLRSREANSRYEPLRDESFYTLEGQRQLLLQRTREAARDRAYLLGIFTAAGQLIGQLTLSNVVRGAAQYADIGYGMDPAWQGQGRMTAAVRLTAAFAFRSLDLHRLQAVILPGNDASRRVLEKVGFQPEGLARRLLQIDGRWQDHRIYGLLAEDLKAEADGSS
ncbi:GNAT family N-acetyltransferase [Paenibacillus glufosinatiresistens]|uniref:GNAT family N-acetyltransferase n=1 Tax=Paenibacillus glufosinatiresistens TaxID=3070657 RepID=UPI00286EB190|nr:GNAT family protein [Paenibacillus sp. YX.27]